MHKISGFSPRLIRSLILFLACLATIALIMSYRGVFNPDTLVHSVLMPSIMAEQGQILLDDFTYSNKDHRTLFISLFHFPTALLAPDKPWQIYFIGSVISSVLYLFVWAKLCERLGLSVLMTTIAVFYFSVTPGALYFEHIHGQNSYILNAIFLLVGLGVMHHVYNGGSYTDRAPVTGVRQIVHGGDSKFVSDQKPRWLFLALFLVVFFETVANFNRSVITLIAPFLIATLSVNIIRWQLPSRQILMSLGVIVLATILGVLIYLYLTSTLTYTMGAAQPISLDKVEGQLQAFKDVGFGFLALTQWYLPVWEGPTQLRNISATVILVYLAYNWCKALWSRNDSFSIFLVVLTAVSFFLFAVAINFADIKMAPRYAIPLMLIILFSLLYFYKVETGWKKFIAPLAFAGLLVDACFYSSLYAKLGHEYKKQQVVLYDYLEENQVNLGVTSRDFVSVLTLEYGIGHFIPIGFSKDGNYRELPFHNLTYYTAAGYTQKTAYVYSENDKLKKAHNERINSLLAAHNLKILSDETIGKVGNRPVNVMIIEGDIQKIFLGKTIGETSKVIFNEDTHFKGAGIDTSMSCNSGLNLSAHEEDFSLRSPEYLLEKGKYLLTVDHNFTQDTFFSDLVIVVQELGKAKSFRQVYARHGLTFDVEDPSRLTFILVDKKPKSGVICGFSVTRIE